MCDQGGECQLQDLAVGYGGTTSRYEEEKRVVFHKDVGPLVSMEEMSRCIHCTRCVRFGQEIAGIMELGMANRNMHSEIMTFVGRSVDSELSGNMIDLCPVGALTSKPYAFHARPWELGKTESLQQEQRAALLRKRSPLMLHVVLEQIRRARGMTLAQDLRMERDLVRHCFYLRPGQSETLEGIRALAVDKDHQPRWQPARIEDVTPAMWQAFFDSPWPAWGHPLAALQ